MKKWLRVSHDHAQVLASTKKELIEEEQRREEQQKKEAEDRKKSVKGKEKEETKDAPPHEVDGSTISAAGGPPPAFDKKATNRPGLTAPQAGERDPNVQFAWTVVRPGDEGWVTHTLVELFSELTTAHGFEDERITRLAGLLS